MVPPIRWAWYRHFGLTGTMRDPFSEGTKGVPEQKGACICPRGRGRRSCSPGAGTARPTWPRWSAAARGTWAGARGSCGRAESAPRGSRRCPRPMPPRCSPRPPGVVTGRALRSTRRRWPREGPGTPGFRPSPCGPSAARPHPPRGGCRTRTPSSARSSRGRRRGPAPPPTSRASRARGPAWAGRGMSPGSPAGSRAGGQGVRAGHLPAAVRMGAGGRPRRHAHEGLAGRAHAGPRGRRRRPARARARQPCDGRRPGGRRRHRGQ